MNTIETKEARKSRFLAIGVAKEIKTDSKRARLIAESKLSQMSAVHPYQKWCDKWQKILSESSNEEIIQLLVRKGTFEQDLPSLRQMSPFIGLVGPKERNKRLMRWTKITSGT